MHLFNPHRPKAEVGNGLYESTENVYEDVTTSVTKKKGKSDKKRKGPPKSKNSVWLSHKL